MRFLFLLYRSHRKGRYDVLSRVDILLDQHPARFWLANTLIKGLFYSESFHFEADYRPRAIASLLNLEIIQALFGENVGVPVLVISDGSVNIFSMRIENGHCLHFDLSHGDVP